MVPPLFAICALKSIQMLPHLSSINVDETSWNTQARPFPHTLRCPLYQSAFCQAFTVPDSLWVR